MASNFYEAFAQGQANGLERQKAITQRNQLAELQSLAPQVMSGDLDATSRAFSLDPTRAQSYQTEGNRQQQQLVGLAKTLKQFANNPQMQAGVYRSALPYLKRNFGTEIPDDFDPAAVMPIVDQVLAVANNTPNFNGQTPTDVRSFQMMTQGLNPEEVERARRINLGLDGRASTSGFSQVKFNGADGRERVGVLNGRTGQIDLPDGTSFNPQTGAISQSTSMQPPMAAPQGIPQSGGDHYAAFSQLATEFPSVSMTSGTRSAERNAQVGGQPNSQHLRGTAADYAVPANQKPAFISRARQMGYQAIDEGDHIHLQLPRGSVGGGGAFVGRTPEEQAALTEAARLGVQQQFLPDELRMRTRAAIDQTAGQEQVRGDAERQNKQLASQAEKNATFALYETAIEGAKAGLEASETGPIAGRIPAFTAAQQTAEGGVAAMAPVLKQLFRSAGEGTFTDKDQDLLLRMIPTRTDLPAARDAKLKNIDNIVRAKLGQGGPAGQAGASRASAPRQIQSAEEYNALPAGALFIAPDGTQRRKR